jgi:hypothetical protein
MHARALVPGLARLSPVSGLTITSTSFERDQGAQDRPEQPIQRAQGRPGASPLQDGDLLAKGEDFESKFSAALEEDAAVAIRARTNVIMDWF